MSDLTHIKSRLHPEVKTPANPTARSLFQARAIILADPDCQSLFDQSLEDSWDDLFLAQQLNAKLEEAGVENSFEAAHYLVAEYRQVDGGVHLIDNDTGRILMTLTDADIWQPEKVYRESGNLAQPLPMLRPDLSAALTTLSFDRGREKIIVEALTNRAGAAPTWVTTPTWILTATRAGRRQIATRLEATSPAASMMAASGAAGAFLRCFKVWTEDRALKSTGFGSVTLNVADPKTHGSGYDHFSNSKGSLARSWIRSIAAHISSDHVATKIPISHITRELLAKHPVWVVPDQAFTTLVALDPTRAYLPVLGNPRMVGVSPGAGEIFVAPTCRVTSWERSDKWCLESTCGYEARVTGALTVLELDEVELTATIDS